MSEDEIKLWESKAKSGMLKNDSILDTTLSSMRAAMISNVKLSDGTEVNMTQFGITTGNYSEKGKLIIDETKLRAALESNPEGSYALFGQTDSSTTTSYTSNDGLFNRLKKINVNTLNMLYDKAGTSKSSSDLTTTFLTQSVMGLELTSYEKRIADLTDRLTMKENQFYKQFTAMETAMNKYNSASSSLTSMLS
ncbi:flagellar capping protein [compost metagenome]